MEQMFFFGLGENMHTTHTFALFSTKVIEANPILQKIFSKTINESWPSKIYSHETTYSLFNPPPPKKIKK